MILALDGGATKTLALVLDEKETKLRGVGVSGPSNLSSAGPKLAEENIADAIRQSLIGSGTSLQSITKGIVGVAGIGDSEELTKLGGHIIDRVIKRPDFEKINDGVPAYYLANMRKDGIVFAGGTGSVAFYSLNSKISRIGGWNWFVGDDGSASSIAKRGINIATMEYDGIYPEKELVAAVELYFGKTFREAVALANYRPDKRYISGFAPNVSRLAADGYERAIEIMEESARYVGNLILALKKRFPTPPKISLVGGTMLAGPFYTDMIKRIVNSDMEIFFGYQVAIGGLLLIMEEMRLEIGPRVRADIIDQMETLLRRGNKSRYEKYLNFRLF